MRLRATYTLRWRGWMNGLTGVPVAASCFAIVPAVPSSSFLPPRIFSLIREKNPGSAEAAADVRRDCARTARPVSLCLTSKRSILQEPIVCERPKWRPRLSSLVEFDWRCGFVKSSRMVCQGFQHCSWCVLEPRHVYSQALCR